MITNKWSNFICDFNPFLVNVPVLYPLKTPENQRFFGAFKGYKMGSLPRYGLNKRNLSGIFRGYEMGTLARTGLIHIG